MKREQEEAVSHLLGGKLKISWQYFQLGPSTDAPVPSNKTFSGKFVSVRVDTARWIEVVQNG